MRAIHPAGLDRPPDPCVHEISAGHRRQLGVSCREAQVLALVLAPYPNAEIAARLGISRRTVESHVSALLRKLAVPDRPALIRIATGLCSQTGPPSPMTLAGGRPATVNQPRPAIDVQVVGQEAYALGPNVLPYNQRADRRNRDAIKAHEAVAELQDSAAALLEAWASHKSHLDRDHVLQVASDFRTRATAARQRANLARARLRANGLDPYPSD
jgi:DNA-binding CsgD family transcriptional regulator